MKAADGVIKEKRKRPVYFRGHLRCGVCCKSGRLGTGVAQSIPRWRGENRSSTCGDYLVWVSVDLSLQICVCAHTRTHKGVCSLVELELKSFRVAENVLCVGTKWWGCLNLLASEKEEMLWKGRCTVVVRVTMAVGSSGVLEQPLRWGLETMRGLEPELHPSSGCPPPTRREGKMGLESITVEKKWFFFRVGMAIGWACSLSTPGICQLAGEEAADLNKHH